MINVSANKQSGAVSLFVVVFAMLIITVITISFLRLMIADQLQASNNDLSQSAYDSAQAGVEDAKRALLRYQKVCNDTPSACAALRAQISQDVCNAGLLAGNVVDPTNVSGTSGGKPGEVMVQQSATSGDSTLNQAYTCVKMKLATLDYIGTLTANASQIVPLIPDYVRNSDGTATNTLDNFDTVTVRWFSRDDISDSSGAISLTGPSPNGQQLPQQADWPANRPSIMRTQLIQFGSSFTLSDFDVSNGSQSNANTLFLYPTSAGAATNSDSFTDRDTRKQTASGDPLPASSTATPLSTKCQSNISGGGYACEMSLKLPDPIGGGSNRTAYLRLTPLYNPTHFQVVLSRGKINSSGTNIVKFKDVQPEVDSTGRANELFRRIVSRVDLYDTTFPYPDATIDVTGNLCKDFGVTDTKFIAGSCTP